MTVEGLLAEATAVNNFRFRQVEKFPQGTANKPVIMSTNCFIFGL